MIAREGKRYCPPSSVSGLRERTMLMMDSRRATRLLRLTLLLAPLLIGLHLPRAGRAAGVTEPRILVHLAVASTKTGSCTPTISDCASPNVNVFGLTYTLVTEFYYFAYILVAGHDATSGIHEIKFAVDFARGTGEGVDIFTWTTCATSLGAADWYVSGAGNQIRWDDCPKADVAVAGYFYMTAYTPGKIGIVPPPGEGPATLTNCGGQPVEIPIGHLGFAGFGDQQGCNPCRDECRYVAVQPTTWSSLKARFAVPGAYFP